MQFWWPLVADPSVYANEGYEAYVDYHSGARSFPRWAEPLFGSLPAQHGAALDVGCGDGAVLSRLADIGYQTYGIDLDEKSIAVARSKHRLDRVEAMTLEAFADRCKQDGRRFDLITCFEVLEHQDRPRDFLEKVKQLGYPCAQLAGSVPNRNRFLSSIDRRLSDGDFPPHHFLWFSEAALLNLLQGAGLTDVTITRTGALSYRQIVGKLCGIVSKKSAKWPQPMRPLATILKGLAMLAAIGPWIGMRAAPSHLFFVCRITH
jgi:SAM-dependent methyltransferase